MFNALCTRNVDKIGHLLQSEPATKENLKVCSKSNGGKKKNRSEMNWAWLIFDP